MITAVAPSPALDLTYLVDELTEGRTHRPLSVHRHAGGKAVNMARAAAALGAEVQVVAALPAADVGFFGDELDLDGVGLLAVEVATPLRTCVSIAARSTGRMTEVYEHAAPLEPEHAAAVTSAVETAVERSPGWVSVSGSAPGWHGCAMARDVLTRARQAVGVRAAVDSHGPALAAAVAAQPDLVKVNREEAAGLVGLPAGSPLGDLVDALRSRCPGLVVVTDSSAGIMADAGQARWQLRVPDVVGTYSQGSGDSLLAGLLAARDQGADDVDALRLGIGAATANALSPGAGRFPPDLARDLAERAVVEAL